MASITSIVYTPQTASCSPKPCEISPHALVAPGAKIGNDVHIGAFSIIGPKVIIGDNVKIHEHVVIKGATSLGADCEIYPFTTIGLDAQDRKCGRNFEGHVRIGVGTLIREHVSIHAPSNVRGVTKIGNFSLIMGQTHVAHDCTIGDNVVVAQGVLLGGHVRVDDNAVLGGGAGIHQHVRIGIHAIVGGASKVIRDVVPFGLADGNRCRLRGVNAVGLRRHGFSTNQHKAIKKAFQILFASGLQQEQALQELRHKNDAQILAIIEFVEASTRGLTAMKEEWVSPLSGTDLPKIGKPGL